MKILTYGEIMERGSSRFTVVAQLSGPTLNLRMTGAIRAENPYRHLAHFLDELKEKVAQEQIGDAVLDFTDLKYCNSIGFYVLMDMIEVVYGAVEGRVSIRRLADDDWQQESLPILLNLDDQAVKDRTSVEDVPAL